MLVEGTVLSDRSDPCCRSRRRHHSSSRRSDRAENIDRALDNIIRDIRSINRRLEDIAEQLSRIRRNVR